MNRRQLNVKCARNIYFSSKIISLTKPLWRKNCSIAELIILKQKICEKLEFKNFQKLKKTLFVTFPPFLRNLRSKENSFLKRLHWHNRKSLSFNKFKSYFWTSDLKKFENRHQHTSLSWVLICDVHFKSVSKTIYL